MFLLLQSYLYYGPNLLSFFNETKFDLPSAPASALKAIKLSLNFICNLKSKKSEQILRTVLNAHLLSVKDIASFLVLRC